ncbi:hypothetical protein CYMTET_17979 [Cymbomonas tetramitiformis]|uniref:DUF7869 domain-containing protein n=1 Tax=Cymbomonas tetramitiformis TaxID=36881 RepID=A0AAE0L6R3_9CHLO|nr:hypothetical protein CYMTET_17979 [Cymbomonas tetramitiformis]|eukprot:gene10045-biopygen10270
MPTSKTTPISSSTCCTVTFFEFKSIDGMEMMRDNSYPMPEAWTLDEMMEVVRESFNDGVNCEHYTQKNYDFESWMVGHHNDLHQISQQQTFKFFKDENGNVVMQHTQY